MCPLLFVRLSVRRAFACVHQRRCLASAPAMATATATTMTMTVTPAMGLSPAMSLSLRVHVLTVAWRRFQLCSLLLRSFSPSPLGCYLFAHIFFKFCHKNWFMWLPQNVCFLSHSTQTLAPTGFPALPPPLPRLGCLSLSCWCPVRFPSAPCHVCPPDDVDLSTWKADLVQNSCISWHIENLDTFLLDL